MGKQPAAPPILYSPYRYYMQITAWRTQAAASRMAAAFYVSHTASALTARRFPHNHLAPLVLRLLKRWEALMNAKIFPLTVE